MDKTDKLKMGKKVIMRQHQDWDDTVTNLDKLKLSKAEQSTRSFSRQSHNQIIAKAELLDKDKLGKASTIFSPVMSAKLRADASKSLNEVLKDGSNTLALAQKIRREGVTNNFDQIEKHFLNGTHATESTEGKENDEQCLTEPNLDNLNYGESEELNENSVCVMPKKTSFSPNNHEMLNAYPLSPHGWQNLNTTIQLVVKTCEALWQQLEEERLNRDRLLIQLEEQRSIVTTLTAELLQVQEHQEIILQELQAARASKLFQNVSDAMLSQPVQDIPGAVIEGNSSFPSNNYDGSRLSPRHYPRQSSSPVVTNADTNRILHQSSPNHHHHHGLLSDSTHSLNPLSTSEVRSTPTDMTSRNQATLRHETPFTLPHSNQLNLQGLSGSHAQFDSQQGYRDSIKDKIHFNNSRMRVLRESAIREQ